MSNTNNKKPTRDAFYVKDDPNGGKGRWLKIGTVFSHDDGRLPAS